MCDFESIYNCSFVCIFRCGIGSGLLVGEKILVLLQVYSKEELVADQIPVTIWNSQSLVEPSPRYIMLSQSAGHLAFRDGMGSVTC
jgi:hypothetical protein